MSDSLWHHVCRLPCSSVHGIFQTRILEWVAISFSRGSSLLGTEPVSPAVQTDSLPTELLGKSQKSFSRVQLFVTSWTIQSMEFFRPEYWSRQPFPSQGTFPTQGLNPGLPHYRQIFTSWANKGSPRTLEWVSNPFSSRSLATHSSIVWKIPWTEEPGRLKSPWGCKESDMT